MKNKTICKILVVSIVLAIVVSGIAVGANTRVSDSNISLSSSTIHVPGDFDTIQEAVWNAAEGDTIIVASGTYRETVWVSVDQITLRGVGMPVVDAEGKGDAFALFGEGITLEGFVATNSSYVQQGIKVTGEKNTIKDNIAINNYQGIVVSHAHNNTITGNNVSHNQYAGIQLKYSTVNRISNNGGSNNSWGISLDFTSTNNTIEKNTLDGISLSSSSNNTITGNNITNYKYDGISLSRSNDNTITDNTATNLRWGIHLSRSRNNTITDNTFNENEMGIYFDRSNNNTVKDNSASNNNEMGIKLCESNNNTISLNKVKYNKGDNFFIDSSGIHLSYSHNNTITDNIARYNNKTAIYFFRSDNNTLTKNTCSNNDDYGISLFASHYNNLTNNTVNSNNHDGIYLRYSSNNNLTNNTALNNDRGIYFDGSHYNNLTKNTASCNNDSGIYLDYSKNNTIYNNYFSNTNNAYETAGANTWNTTKTLGTNIVGGPYLGGNYWSDYKGTDLDGDKLGDTLLPYNSSGSIQNGGDYHPLIIIPKIILKASKDGYASVQHEIDNDENLGSIEISGNVTDELTTEPIEGANVEIVSGADPASTTTDADGTYIITAIMLEGSGSDTREDVNFELPPAEYIITAETFTAEIQQAIEDNDGTVLETFDVPDGSAVLILVNVSKEEKIEAFLENVGAVPGVRYIDPNRVRKVSYIPNDPEYPLQWGPRRIQAGGLPNPSAWDWEPGNKNVTIAILDTGVDYNHRDLKPNYKIGGYDWVNDDNDPMDDDGHGTHVAGIAAAVIDNNNDTAGMAQCNIISEKMLNGGVFDEVKAIYDASMQNADILSMSFGGFGYIKAEEAACHYAWLKGCILVAASGNERGPWVREDVEDIPAVYPASYEDVIAVGAIDQNDNLAIFSNWGSGQELVAPGVDILSTRVGGGTTYMTGTSMAAPHVSGVAALLKSHAKQFPPEPLATDPWYHLNNKQIRTIMQRTAEDLGPAGRDQIFGYGLVDAESALRCVNISGNVLESVFNAPIPHPPGAPFPPEVRVTSIEGPPGIYTTNENTALARITPEGDYHVRVPQGVYSICAMAFGYIPSRGLGGERVELPAFDFMGRLNTEYRELRLVPFPCSVTGNVTDGVTGLSIKGASVSLDGPPHIYPPHPNVHMDTSTDSGGNYSFILEYGVHPPYPIGVAVYNITVSKEGYQTQTQNFTLNWSDVVKDYYKCPLDPNDYNPPIVNFSLPPYLPDLTLTSNDIQLILPSSAGQRILDMTTSYTEKTAAKLLETTKNVRPSGDIIHNQESENEVSITSSLPSFMIVNLTYPPTVDPNQTFQVTVHTNYTFENTTYVYVGIWDYDASEYIAGTPIPETTLSGSGNTSYTLNLTAPPSGIMDLSADLCYWDGYDLIFTDFRDFDVNVGTQNFTIENLTYPPTVNPDQTFQVTVDANYSFSATTNTSAGIWDYDASEYIAGTPVETLSGIGNKSYTFNLTAPSSGMMNLSADLCYWDDYYNGWFLLDYRDFNVNISAEGPDFTITATPSSQTVSQGDSASYTISLTSLNEFNSPVTLTVSGLSGGATGLFNPNPVIPSNVSNLTINTIGTTPTGNHTLSITGVSSEITHQTTVALNVTGKETISTISATIHNIGVTDASDVLVQFFDGDPDAGGIQIGSDQTISSIPAEGTGNAQVSWNITEKVGSHVIYVKIDPYNMIAESDEGNNQAFRQIAVPGVTCSDPDVVIDDTKTSVTDDHVGDGYNVSNAPEDVDLTDVRGFDITATGPDGAHLFDITFSLPVTENFVLYKLPAWTEIPYTTIGPYTIQVQLEITGGVLDPAFILASVEGIRGDLNNDGKITPADAVIALQIAAGSRPCDAATLAAADVSGDGQVTSLDALMIMQVAVGNIEL